MKNFKVGVTKNGVLNDNGGKVIQELESKSQYNFQYIPKEDIIANPKNKKYTQDGIPALCESILVNGLRHNLSVLYDATQNKYRIISGERRYRAIASLPPNDYKRMFPTGIPCKVEKNNIDEMEEEIMLISANHDVRETSMEVKRWEVSRLKELYEAKNLSGKVKNINAEIAKQLNITERQARKYTTAEKLIPELSDMLNHNIIDLNKADKFGRLDEEAQFMILDLINQKGEVENSEYQSIKKLSEEKAEEAKKYKEELEAVLKKVEEKEAAVNLLEEKIKHIENNISNENSTTSKSKEQIEEELKYMTNAKNNAEKERLKLETAIEKLKQQQQEKINRKISINDSELKRITSIAKAEQALNYFENNFDILKNSKNIIKEDIDLKTRLEILKNRMNEFFDSINN